MSTRKNKLPNKLSDLIYIAIEDVKKVEKQKDKYILDMDVWHSVFQWDEAVQNTVPSTKCSVCMAGSVMACTLNTSSKVEKEPYDFGTEISQKLEAIDNIRCGEIQIPTDSYDDRSYFWLQDQTVAIKKANELIGKHFNQNTGHAPWGTYLRAAKILESAGL